MKKILLLMFWVLLPAFLSAQNCSFTPAVHLCKPVIGSPSWGAGINGNMDTLDGMLGGTTALPQLNVRTLVGNVFVSGTLSATSFSGIPGTRWFNGTASPGVITGASNGDFYLDTVANNTWKCSGSGPDCGSWSFISQVVSLKGIPLPTLNASTGYFFDNNGTLQLVSLTKTSVGLTNVDNTSDVNKPVSTATQTALDLKANDNNVMHLTGTETASGIKTFSTSITINNFANLVSNNHGLTSVTGDFWAYSSSGAKDVWFHDSVSNTKFLRTSLSAVGLNTVPKGLDAATGLMVASKFTDDGTTGFYNGSALALDSLVVHNTRTVNGFALSSNISLAKGDVGLGNVDNTSDVNKPVSTTQQTALNLKANDNNVMHLTGTETASGIKTFSTSITINNFANLVSNNHGLTSVTGDFWAYSSSGAKDVWFHDSLGNTKFLRTSLAAIGTNILPKGNDAATGLMVASKFSDDGTTGYYNGSALAMDPLVVHNTRTVNGYALSGNVTLTKTDLALFNVDNTSDANKPISTATAAALSGKVSSGASLGVLAGNTATHTGTYSVVQADYGTMVRVSNIGLTLNSLPSPPAVGAFFWLKNTGSFEADFSSAGHTIDGLTSLALQPGQTVMVFSDGSQYYTTTGRTTWGAIDGTLSNQTDLAAELALKPGVVAAVNLTGQSTSISPVTFYTPLVSGMYRVSCYSSVTQVATSSSTLPSTVILFTDVDANAAASAQCSRTDTLNQLGSNSVDTVGSANNITISAKAGAALSYRTNSYSSTGATAMNYALHIRVEFIGQ